MATQPTDLIPGWSQTEGGLAVPAGMDLDRMLAQDRAFAAFMGELKTRLPAVVGEVAKSLAAQAPQTAGLTGMEYVGLWGGVKEPQTVSGLSFEMMRSIADKVPPISAIIVTRCNRVASFAQLPESQTDIGMKVALRDADRQPSKEERDEMRRLEDMILECRLPDVADVDADASFESFLRKGTRDSLTLDAFAFEVIPGLNRVKYPVVGFKTVDAAQIRLTEPTEYKPKRDERNIFAVQMRQSEILAEYAKGEMGYGVRNPSTSSMRMGYGTSELEWLTKIASCILFGIDYNEKYFTGSSIPPGILSITGAMSPEMLESFQRQWQSQVGGVGNWWRTPVIATKDGAGAQYTKFRDSNRDMEYHQFLAFMITLACAVYQIHPEEIGMQSWAPQQATLNQPNPQSRIEASADRGLKPLLRMISNLVNRTILWQMYPDRKYILRWVNIDPADEERELKLRRERMESGLSIPSQEIAQMDGEKHPYADVPVNPYHFQAWQAEHQEQGRLEAGDEPEKNPPFPQARGKEPLGQEEGEEPEEADQERPFARKSLRKGKAETIEVIISDE